MEPQIKTLKGTPKHLSRTGMLDGFTYLMVNLPYECNYRCRKCFNRNDNAPFTGHGTLVDEGSDLRDMHLEERLRVILEAKTIGGKAVVIAGEGEPSLHPDIRNLVSEIHSLGMVPIIYSNGSTLTPELVEFYLERNAALVIAFDTLDPARYNCLTGTTGMYHTAVANIKNAIARFNAKTYVQDGMRIFGIAINTTVSGINAGEVAQIKAFWGDDVYFICNPLAKLGNAEGNWDALMTPGISIEEQQRLIAGLSESGGPLTLGSDGLCGYSSWGIGVSPTGEYMTCAYTDKTTGLLGSIMTASLAEAFEAKHRLESGHYARFGAIPCLVRAPSFEGYLVSLQAHRSIQKARRHEQM